MTAEEVCVPVVGEDSGGDGQAATRLREQGHHVHVADNPKTGLGAGHCRMFDTTVFLRRDNKPVEVEIVEAAQGRKREVAIMGVEPDERVKAKVPVASGPVQARADEVLLDASRRFQNLLDAVFDGVVMVDVATETITAANAAAARLLGYTREEMRGMSVWESIPEDRVGDARRMLEEVLKAGRLTVDGVVLRRKSGESLHCKCNAMVTAGLSETLVQVVFRDVNERRMLIELLSEAGGSVPLSEVVSGIVHEINNPLAAIAGYAQLSLTTASRKKLDEYLQTIHQQVGRLQTIVQKLSSLARGPRPQRKRSDLNKIIEEVVSLFACELKINDIELKLNVCPSPIPVEVDRTQIRQVLVNLINHARDAMAASQRRKLSICTERSEQEAVVTVSDTGPGVVASPLEEMFDPSFSPRAHRAGLGLSSSRAIVDANDGEIEALAKPGDGTSLRIRFPLAR